MKITQDIHIHTTHSDGCTEAGWFVRSALSRGLNTIGFADHMWDNGKGWGIASYCRHGNNYAKLSQIRADIAKETIPDGLRVLVGCECDFIADSTLGVSREVAGKLDFVLAPPSHTHFPEVMPPEIANDRAEFSKFIYNAYLRLVKHPDADIITSLAHPFASHVVAEGDSDLLARITDAELREAFRITAEKGIGVEINSAVVRFSCQSASKPEDLKNGEYFRIFSLAKECGCKFTFGSDAHSAGMCDYFYYAQLMADALELKDENVKLI